MKNTIINKTINKAVIYITAIVLAVMIGNTATAQNTDTIRSEDGEYIRVYQRPIHPENYLYLPSFKEWSMGLDWWNCDGLLSDSIFVTNCSPSVYVFGHNNFFDSTQYLPTEAISQKFMIDSTITIYGVALYRDFKVLDSSLLLDWCRIEDSIQIQSLNHDTVYRSMSIAHLRIPDPLMGVYEYYFSEPLTISKPFTVVEKYSKEHYRRIREYLKIPRDRSTKCLGDNTNPEYYFHSNQRPSIKHYGDSNWYEFKDDPHTPYLRLEYCSIEWPQGYTDLYMLPIYSKAPEPTCNVSVKAEPEGYGTVSGSGNYDMFSYVTIQAFPNENYRFVCWENIPLCDNPLTIRVMGDTVFTAIFDTILPTEIDMAEIDEGITIHPNPATTTLNIELPQSCTAELRNIKGVLIETKTLQANATQWNIETLPPGLYMLTLRNNDWVITRKFVKK